MFPMYIYTSWNGHCPQYVFRWYKVHRYCSRLDNHSKRTRRLSYLSRLPAKGPRDAVGKGDGDHMHRPGTAAPHGMRESTTASVLPSFSRSLSPSRES